MYSSMSTFFCLALLLGGSSVLAQANHTPTIKELLTLKNTGSPKMLSDGRFIAYEVRETNWQDNQFIRQLWLVNAATGGNFQLTRGKKSADGASWDSSHVRHAGDCSLSSRSWSSTAQ